MVKRWASRSAPLALAVALALLTAIPAGGAPATAEKLTDFYTSALQGDGTFQWVYCRQATRVVKADGSAVETYACELSGWVDGDPPGMGPDIFGEIVYPDSAVRFEDVTGLFYFSDFLFLTTGDVCFADTWREQLTPSGQVHFKAEYSGNPPCRT